MPKPPVLWVRAEDAASVTTPVIGGAGSDFGSPSYAYSAAKFGNGVSNSVATTGKAYAGITPDVAVGSAGCWVKWLNLTPTNHTDMCAFGNATAFSAPALVFGYIDTADSFFIGFHATAGKYFYLRPTAADLAFSAALQLQYFELCWDAAGLTAGTAIGDGNISTLLKCYSTDSSGVLAERTLTASSTYAGSITFGDIQGAGVTATNFGIGGNSITGLTNTAYVDNLKLWDYKRTLAEIQGDHLNERGSIDDQTITV